MSLNHLIVKYDERLGLQKTLANSNEDSMKNGVKLYASELMSFSRLVMATLISMSMGAAMTVRQWGGHDSASMGAAMTCCCTCMPTPVPWYGYAGCSRGCAPRGALIG